MRHIFMVTSPIAIAFLSSMLPIVFFSRRSSAAKLIHFFLLSLSGIGLVSIGLLTLLKNLTLTSQFSAGLPFITYSIHLDKLAGFFLCIIGIITATVAFYGPSYLRYYENTKQSINTMLFFTGIFVASMSLVVLANNVFTFIFSWELMSITSYFLVIYHHENADNRRAGFVYLLMAHLSGLLILFAFGILAKFSGNFDFQSMQMTHLSPTWTTCVFLLAFVGFGIKSGLIPFHAWLPQAHPAAPSHISALMSGVMLKVAVYGFIRFTFTLLGQPHWQWGVLVLLAGSLSALLGVLYALMQHNLKCILAYHSIENIGIIFIGLGLSIIFISYGHPILGALGLIAALYHCLNHAIFKSLLFLGAGSVVQHTHEHNIEHMGGLIHKMPQTALFVLIGCISISALPPFNGFVSEWLTFQTSLQVSVLHSGGIIRILIPIAAAMLALTGALAAVCFAKVYGIAFLGKARTRRSKRAKKTGFGMRFAMGILALLCLLFGILPTFVIYVINGITLSLLHTGLSATNLHHWLWVAPISSKVSSYSAPLLFIGLLIFCFLAYIFFKRFSHSTLYKQVTAWDCGFGGLTPRMQYTATAFAMPIRRVFSIIWDIDEKVTPENQKRDLLLPPKIKYELHVNDRIWNIAYKPLGGIIQNIARKLSKLQGGNIRVYLAYTFFTLILLLLVIS